MQHTNIKATIQANIELVYNNDGVVTTSLQISDIFNKQHPHVIRGIEKIISETDKKFSQSNFGLAKYKDSQGKMRKSYNLTKDGFMLLAMSFTGIKSQRLKVAYINEFNRMEATLNKVGYRQPPQLDNLQIKLTRETINDFIKDYGIKHAPKGQLINSRRAFMQVHGFIHKYFNIASYKNLDAEELASLTQALNDNAKTIFASVRDLFVVDLKDNNAITQSGNFIRIRDEDGSIYGYSLDYILALVNKEKNAKHSGDSDKPLETDKSSKPANVVIPHHLETILNTVQSILINCHNQIDMVKSGESNLDIEQSIRIMKSIAPNFKMCTTNIEMVIQTMFVENCKAAKNTSAKDVLDNIAYSIL